MIKCEGIHLTFQDSPWEHNYKNKREKEIRVMEAEVLGTVLESCPGHLGVKAEYLLEEASEGLL